MERQPDSEDERPPLPSVPPPPLSPSTTPPPTPATPSPHRLDSPAPFGKEFKKTHVPDERTTKVCPMTEDSVALSRTKDQVTLTFSRDPIVETIQSRNPGQVEEQSGSEFNLDLDNFSRELMNVFEVLDAKIIAHERASDDVCFALLPKSLRPKASTSAVSQKVGRKVVDSQNYIVTSANSGDHQQQRNSNSGREIADKSSDSKQMGDSRSVSNKSNLNLTDCDGFGVKERAVPSPARKFEDVYDREKLIPPSLSRSSSLSSSTGRTRETLPGTIFNQSYRQDRSHQGHRRSESFDGSNTSYMLYNTNDDNHSDNNQNSSNSNSNNNFNKHKSASFNCYRNGLKDNPSPGVSFIPQTPKQAKSGFHNFCNRLKQRSAPNRSVYRQYVKQVIDTAPKLDGYDSDIGGSHNYNNFEITRSGTSLCSSPVPSPESSKYLRLSDGAPVHIFGTVRKQAQEVRGIGHAFRNIRNLFSATGKQDEARFANLPSQKEFNDVKGTQTKIPGHSFRDAENRPQTERNHMDTSSFPFNDSTLKRRTSFQSLLSVFNKPEVHQSTWASKVDNGKLACDFSSEPRADPYHARSTQKDWEGGKARDATDCGGYGNLTSSKRFVSCLEIRLGK